MFSPAILLQIPPGKLLKGEEAFFIFARHHLALEGNSQYIGAGGEQF